MSWTTIAEDGTRAETPVGNCAEISLVPVKMANQIPVLIVRLADNEVHVAVNGRVAYFRHTEGAPKLNDKVDLSGYLQPGRNIIHLVAVNTSGPAHCVAEIYDRDGGRLMGHFEKHVPNNAPRVFGIFYSNALIVNWS